jgi:hypothetical protein
MASNGKTARTAAATGGAQGEEKSIMTKTLMRGALCAAFPLGGCATQSQQLDTRQGGATQTALARGRFELNCPTATATVLSRDYIQPAIQGPRVAGLNHVEYTVGVAGCNQRTTYVVLCQEGTSTCFAANPAERFQGR